LPARDTGQTFFLPRAAAAADVDRGACAALLFCVRTELLEKASVGLLGRGHSDAGAGVHPGLGHMVNGSRRWLQLAGLNFQASELARVLVLIYLASYAVRREEELRTTFGGLIKPLGLLVFVGALLLAEPDFGAATVLFATGFGILFIAGARLRYVIAMTVIAGAGFAARGGFVQLPHAQAHDLLNPWADPYNSGFQLTQSLIAIGRGQWFGWAWREACRNCLPAGSAYRLLVCRPRGGARLGGRRRDARSFPRVDLAQLLHRPPRFRCGLKFQSYLAAAFGLWVWHTGVHSTWA